MIATGGPNASYVEMTLAPVGRLFATTRSIR